MAIRIVFDVDDTISTNIRRLSYDQCEPKQDVIDKLNYLHDELGYTIILHTSRGMVSCNGDMEKIIKKNKTVLENWLEKHNVHYDELIFGKPIADLYVDDKALDVAVFSQAPFNILSGGGSNKSIHRLANIVKKDLGDEESTERFKDWVEDCGGFCDHPRVISYLYSEVYMEYIEGERLCDNMDFTDFVNVLMIIQGFAGRKRDNFTLQPQVSILEKNYSDDEELNMIIDICKSFLRARENEFKKHASLGHGDMILSNIIKNEKGLYLIDPRYFRESSTYLFDYGKLRMSFMNYEKRFGISEKDNSIFLKPLDGWLKNNEIYELVLIANLMYVCRLFRYKKESDREIITEMAKEILRELGEV